MQYPGFMQGYIDRLAATPPGGGLEGFLCNVYPWIITVLMAGIMVWYLMRYCYEGYTGRYLMGLHRNEPHEELRYLRFGRRPVRAILWVLIMYAASRAIWLIALDIYVRANGWTPVSLESLPEYVNKWDAVNYTRIAQYWYGFEDHGIDGYVKEYTIAFLPGFPLMIRALNLIVGDYVLSGLILSNIMTIGSGLLLYVLVSDMYSEPAARRSCFFFFFSMAAGVFSATHSESALFFLTLLAVFLARRRHFIMSVCVGAYACFTRQFGMFVAVPVFFEMLRSMERYPTGSEMIMRERADTGAVGGAPTLLERARHSVRLRQVWRYFLLAACVLVGYGVYMLINQIVYGSPTAFLYYQKLNWGNEIAPIWDCLHINAESLFRCMREGREFDSVIGIFVPQLMLALILPVLMLCFARRGDAGDNAYAWCYVALTFSSSWLISGIRYVAAMYPLYIMLALLSSKRGWRYVLYPLTILAFIYFNVMYSVHGLIV